MLWGPSRHLGSLTAANWVSFDFNVSYSSCWGYSLINTFKLKKKRMEPDRPWWTQTMQLLGASMVDQGWMLHFTVPTDVQKTVLLFYIYNTQRPVELGLFIKSNTWWPDPIVMTWSNVIFPCRDGKIRKKNVFRRRKNRILPLHLSSPSASTKVVHRARSQSPLHFDIRNI